MWLKPAFPKFTVLSIKLLLLETSIKSLNVCSTNSTLGKEQGKSILLAQLIHAKQWTRGDVSQSPARGAAASAPVLRIYVEAQCVFIGAPISTGKTTSLCSLLGGKHSRVYTHIWEYTHICYEDPATTELCMDLQSKGKCLNVSSGYNGILKGVKLDQFWIIQLYRIKISGKPLNLGCSEVLCRYFIFFFLPSAVAHSVLIANKGSILGWKQLGQQRRTKIESDTK